MGRGCAELHDRIMVSAHCRRLELDVILGFIGKHPVSLSITHNFRPDYGA